MYVLHNLVGTLVYLACDETKCIPKWDQVNFSFSIQEGEKRKMLYGDFVRNVKRIV